MTEEVFRNHLLVGYSLAVLIPTAAVASGVLLLIGMRAYRGVLNEAERGSTEAAEAFDAASAPPTRRAGDVLSLSIELAEVPTDNGVSHHPMVQHRGNDPRREPLMADAHAPAPKVQGMERSW